jgi:hypothetical protein
VVATPANFDDSTVLPRLLHGNETRVRADQAYRGQRAVIRQHALRAQDLVNRRYRLGGVVDEVERADVLVASAARNDYINLDGATYRSKRVKRGCSIQTLLLHVQAYYCPNRHPPSRRCPLRLHWVLAAPSVSETSIIHPVYCRGAHDSGKDS